MANHGVAAARLSGNGVPCPRCGSGDAGVYKTKPADGGTVRYKKCKSCLFRFVTSERLGSIMDAAARNAAAVIEADRLLPGWSALAVEDRAAVRRIIAALSADTPTITP